MEGTTTMPMSLAAAAANCRCSRVVFVGNIPFHASEKELRDACELIGPIRSLRLAADPATGKRKGYAFVEYPDDETARSAVRNLSGHHLRGRELRVNLAGRHYRRRARGDNEPVGLEDAIHAASLVSGSPPPDPVTRYLAARSPRELREMAAALQGDGPQTLKLLQEHVPGLAAVMEQVRNLLDMAAADEAAEEAKSKKRAAAAAEANDDHRAKLAKVEVDDGGFKDKIAVSGVGVPCF
ncbi:unnamed protein product [Urochloa decumbens]|uniref:RRM domain-containing protein n=1 Tax=Urochloa decumbens TaxID=240449 RepID=A0ABC8X6L7_9POAL